MLTYVVCRFETQEVDATATVPDRNEVVYSRVRRPSKALGVESYVSAVDTQIDSTLPSSIVNPVETRHDVSKSPQETNHTE
jgi:hypothetical protein